MPRFEYKVVVGIAEPGRDGVPGYSFDVPKRPCNLEAVLNRLAAEGWEPWQLALPTSYCLMKDRPQETPVTLVFRRELGPAGSSVTGQES
jgi:hypothetical protein